MDPIEILTAIRDERGSIVDFRMEAANSALRRSAGRTSTELVGGSLRALFPDIDPQLLVWFADVVETGRPLHRDAVSLQSAIWSGQQRLFDLRGVRVGDADQLMVTWRDITEFGEKSRLLTTSERLYRLVSENTTDVVMVFKDGAIQWASPSSKEILGQKPEHLVGRHWSSFVSDEGDLQSLRDQAVTGARTRTRVRLRSADGSGHWLSVDLSPYLDEDGTRLGTLVSARLIDHEVAAEEEVSSLLRQRNLILARSPIGVFRVRIASDTTFVRDYVSARALELLGIGEECVLASCLLHDPIPDASRSALLDAASTAAHDGTPLVCEIHRADAGQWIRTLAHVERTPDGAYLMDGIVEDATLAKSTEVQLAARADAAALEADQLSRVVKIKSALLSALGHDLRTPLAVIASSSASLLDGDAVVDDDRTELVTHIQASALQLGNLVESLLDAHRLDVGAAGVELGPVDVLEVLEAPLRSAGVAVALDIPDSFPQVVADAGLLERVLDNLLANAVRHSAPGTRPTVLARRTGDRATLQVIQRGEGVPTKRYPELFEPFRRLTDSRDGLGVGLSIALAFTQAMGMELTPEPTPGGGLTMTLTAKVVPDGERADR